MLDYRKYLCVILLAISSCYAGVVLQDTEGHSIPFSSLKGKWVFINYWASWCNTCVDEIPELNRFYEKYQDSVVVYAINFDNPSLYQQNRLVKKFQIRYPSLVNNPGEALGLNDIPGIPVTFIFNPEGKLSSTLYGGQSVRTLEDAMRRQS